MGTKANHQSSHFVALILTNLPNVGETSQEVPMAMSIERGVFSTAVGVGGAGAIIMWPDQWWIGLALLVVSAMLFVWGIRINDRHLWQPFWRKKLVPAPVMSSSIVPIFEQLAPFSNALAPRPRRDTRLEDALSYIVLGKWNVSVGEALGLHAFGAYGAALQRFRELAGEGEVQVWGKRDRGALFEEIPAEFWIHQGVDLSATLTRQSRTEPKTLSASGERYYDLMVSRTEIESAWPHAG